jgi:hypothetical protein
MTTTYNRDLDSKKPGITKNMRKPSQKCFTCTHFFRSRFSSNALLIEEHYAIARHHHSFGIPGELFLFFIPFVITVD